MSDVEEAKQMIEEERNKRAEVCFSEIQKILQKYNCTMSPFITIDDEGITRQITIKAL